jgi:hypothetical protein
VAEEAVGFVQVAFLAQWRSVAFPAIRCRSDLHAYDKVRHVEGPTPARALTGLDRPAVSRGCLRRGAWSIWPTHAGRGVGLTRARFGLG